MKKQKLVAGIFFILSTTMLYAQTYSDDASNPYGFSGPTNSTYDLKREFKYAGFRFAQQVTTDPSNRPFYAQCGARLNELFAIGINRGCSNNPQEATAKWNSVKGYADNIIRRNHSVSAWNSEYNWLKTNSEEVAEALFVNCRPASGAQSSVAYNVPGFIKSRSGKYRVQVWSENSDNTKGKMVYDGWVDADNTTKIFTERGRIIFSYKPSEADNWNTDNHAWCKGGPEDVSKIPQ